MNKIGIILITIFVIIIVIAIVFITIYFKNKSLLKIKGGRYTALIATNDIKLFNGVLFTLYHQSMVNGIEYQKISKFGDFGYLSILHPEYLSDPLYFNNILLKKFGIQCNCILSRCEYNSKYLREFAETKNIFKILEGFFEVIKNQVNNPTYISNFFSTENLFYYNKKFYDINCNLCHNQQQMNDLKIMMEKYFSDIATLNDTAHKNLDNNIANVINITTLNDTAYENLDNNIDYYENLLIQSINSIIIDFYSKFTQSAVYDEFNNNENLISLLSEDTIEDMTLEEIYDKIRKILYQSFDEINSDYFSIEWESYFENFENIICNNFSQIPNIEILKQNPNIGLLIQKHYENIPEKLFDSLLNNISSVFISSNKQKYDFIQLGFILFEFFQLKNYPLEFFQLGDFSGINDQILSDNFPDKYWENLYIYYNNFIDNYINYDVQNELLFNNKNLKNNIIFAHIDISYDKVNNFNLIYEDSYNRIVEYLKECVPNNINSKRFCYDNYGKYLYEGVYETINIPKTEISFSMDVFSTFILNDKIYIVQIEHSEKGQNHKSNMVEFIGLVATFYDITGDDLYNEIQRKGYKYKRFMKDVKNKNNLELAMYKSNKYIKNILDVIPEI